MKKAPLYSRSRQRSVSPAPSVGPTVPPAAVIAASAPNPAKPSAVSRLRARVHAMVDRHRILVTALLASLLVLGGGLAGRALVALPAPLTQKDIDAAVRQSLEKEPLPSKYAKAYAAVRPSVVRVVGLDDENEEPPKPGEDPKAHTRSTGTGVVIVDNGTILTNLHVVVGAKRVKVTFFDGHESEASMVGAQPENDLAVLRAKSIPDDLQAATMRGTGDLVPGDEVLAVGFPFGIGPSASGGIVSGLKRSFRAPEGERLTNLIQFDAAANPGNSGGPLVTMDGSVVGIVTAFLNPGDQGTFIGIGFAVPIENAASAVGMPPF
jgi:S1-C subfamily serine protease